ncbi:hypothetical protein PV08_09149 [Exophiala spinifera]|uniref:Uncharacterized protein n=1 Tax=Exophiala spinifera TaxID=91928 RepID=A0A0D1YA99_9EURO|nr:uncharacterized protein PV08_09149 [Exophiala spinifera]KIW11876.1 hypothetical protein PV08_09149 [Exophiala spinifera]
MGHVPASSRAGASVQFTMNHPYSTSSPGKPRWATRNRLSPERTEDGLYQANNKKEYVSASDHGHNGPAAAAAHRAANSPVNAVAVLQQSRRQDLYQSITLFPELSSLELCLLESMLHKQIEVDRYIIGPSFRERHQQAFVDYLQSGMTLVKDAFIACMVLLVENPQIRKLAQDQHVGHKRAANALASLRHLEVSGSDNSSAVLMLGIAIVTFASHHSGGELPLCRHTLDLVKRFHDNEPTFIKQLSCDGISALNCLLATETFICLLRGHVPSIRIREGDFDGLVDRFMGVSAPLLTHLYDVCQLIELIRRSRRESNNSHLRARLRTRLKTVEQTLRVWQPMSLESLREGNFTPTEITLMLTQVMVLRQTALIVLYRLQHAFGTHDGRAIAMSRYLVRELHSMVRLTGRSAPCLDFPYLFACFELVDRWEREAALCNLHLVAEFSPRTADDLKTWLVSFWTARDNSGGGSIYWDDIESHLFGTGGRM